MNKRIIAYTLITLSVLLSLLFFQEEVSSLSQEVRLSTLVGIAAIASGVSGILMSLSTKRVANFEAIREYFQQGDTPEMTKARHNIYESENKGVDLDPEAATLICSFFHFWGMMVKKGFLPLWIFKSASGPSIVRLHHLVTPYIAQRRLSNNKYYGEGFEYLAKRITKEYKYTYIPRSEDEEE
ncbi:DUF4760 domain-containing protein [Guptibacillus hwajinpoensis]|uniref:DUF4760 domain-containing protein n=1 Tax=Guptibacillus hwajinpoensis TaxID=208199 RepID=UPI001A7EE61D|nr:hypothetical protein [Pseudalkalibacillus hwajinpoensis]